MDVINCIFVFLWILNIYHCSFSTNELPIKKPFIIAKLTTFIKKVSLFFFFFSNLAKQIGSQNNLYNLFFFSFFFIYTLCRLQAGADLGGFPFPTFFRKFCYKNTIHLCLVLEVPWSVHHVHAPSLFQKNTGPAPGSYTCNGLGYKQCVAPHLMRITLV